MTINQLWSFFQYDFIVRGFVIGLLVAILASILGHFIVLRKMAFIGDGLAHVAYFAVAISITFFSQSIWLNLLIATLASLSIQWLIQTNKGYSDTIIGGIATTAIALGTLIIANNPNQNVSIEQFLFGSLLLLRQVDMLAVITLAVIIILVVSLWFHELMAMTFDPDFAKVNHYLPQLLQTTVSLLTSWLVIIGIRSTGSLLMSSFLLFPTLIVMNFKQGFKPSFFLGIGLAASNFVIGFLLSLWLDWPTGSTIVVSYSVIWLVTVITTSILQRSKR